MREVLKFCFSFIAYEALSFIWGYFLSQTLFKNVVPPACIMLGIAISTNFSLVRNMRREEKEDKELKALFSSK